MEDARCNLRLSLPLFLILTAYFLVVRGKNLNTVVDLRAQCMKKQNSTMSKKSLSSLLVEESSGYIKMERRQRLAGWVCS